MKKKILPILYAVCSILNCTAQTNVSGFINANITWNLAGSPYIVVGNALLSHGYTLTIDPGVVVKFNSSTALQIDGELHAIGTSSQRITFTSNQAVPAPGDWAKIHFADTSVNAVFDINGNYLSGCIMKYCDVMYGGQIGAGNIHIERSSPYISQCNILNSGSNGIACNFSSFVIDSSSIKNCVFYGLLFYDFFTSSCDLTIHNDSIINNAGGIKLAGSAISCGNNHHIKIRNNYFSDNHTKSTIYCDQGLSNINISENTFINNQAEGGIVEFRCCSVNDTIECNSFIGNQVTEIMPFGFCGTVLLGSLNTSSGVVRDNLFDGNIEISPHPASASAVFINNGSAPATLSNNFFQNNVSQNGSCCFISASTNSVNPPLFIESNRFVNNSGASTLALQGGGIGNANLVSMKHNNFTDVNSQIQFYNGTGYGSININIDSNYWGTTNVQHIDSVIYDYFDDASKSVVFYQPVLTSPFIHGGICFPIGNPTGIVNEIANTGNISIFPNPFSMQTTIRFGEELHNTTFSLYNLLGEKVAETSGINGESFQFNRSNLRSGVYVFEVTEGKSIWRGKAVVY